MKCSKHRVRLLEHGVKVYKQVLEKRYTKLVDIGNHQFGFCQSRSTSGVIFSTRQLQEKNIQKKKKLMWVYSNHHRVLREMIQWIERRKEVIHKGSSRNIRTVWF